MSTPSALALVKRDFHVLEMIEETPTLRPDSMWTELTIVPTTPLSLALFQMPVRTATYKFTVGKYSQRKKEVGRSVSLYFNVSSYTKVRGWAVAANTSTQTEQRVFIKVHLKKKTEKFSPAHFCNLTPNKR